MKISKGKTAGIISLITVILLLISSAISYRAAGSQTKGMAGVIAVLVIACVVDVAAIVVLVNAAMKKAMEPLADLRQFADGDYREGQTAVQSESGEAAKRVRKQIHDTITGTRQEAGNIAETTAEAYEGMASLNNGIDEMDQIMEVLIGKVNEVADAASTINEASNEIGTAVNSVADKATEAADASGKISARADNLLTTTVDAKAQASQIYHSTEDELEIALKEVEKILGDTQEPAVFTLGPKHILFEIGEATLVCRLLEGEFLDWRQVVPTNCPVKLVANVSKLAASFERVGLIVNEKVKSPVRCTFGENEAHFITSTPIGNAEDRCDLAGNGEGLEIGFNYRYILDALRAVPSEEVALEMKDGMSPIVFTPVRPEDDFAYMVLPVRLKNK